MDPNPSIVASYHTAAMNFPHRKAFLFGEPNFKKHLTYLEVWTLAMELHWKFRTMGIQPDDRVAIWAASSWRWEVAQLALLMCQAVVVGIDINETTKNLAYEEHLTNLKFVFYEKEYLKEKWCKNPGTKAEFIPLQDLVIESTMMGRSESIRRPYQDDLLNLNIDPEQPSLIIFTSGTTSEPKGIAYNQKNIHFAVENILKLYPEVTENPRTICWLPLSNLFQRMLNFATIEKAGEIYFIENPIETISLIAKIEPNLFIAVPRVYEKIFDSITSKVRQTIFPINKILLNLLDLQIYQFRYRNHFVSRRILPLLTAPTRYLFRKAIRKLLGARMQILISGSAPLRPNVIAFFHSIGLPLVEAYGTSENAVPIAANTLQHFKIGTVGRPTLKDSVRISSEGEVLVHSPAVFTGYLKANSNDSFIDGYYRTGDLGFLDSDGFLHLIGRRNDVFKTATGKKVPVTDIELTFKKLPYVDQVVVLGSGRKIPYVLLTLDLHQLAHYLGRRLDNLFDSDTGVFHAVDQKKLNVDLLRLHQEADLTIKPIGALLLHRRLSVDDGEMTPNMKVKKLKLEQKYSHQIDQLYLNDDKTTFSVIFLDQNQIRSVTRPAFNPIQRAITVTRITIEVAFFAVIARFRRHHKNHFYHLIGQLLRDGLGSLRGPLHKLGQILSLMPEHMPPEIAEELRALFKDSQPIDPSLIKSIIEKDFHKPLMALFAEWSDKPLSTGSIGQVHWARLHSGQEVAVKVLLPRIREILNSDLKIIKLATPLLKRTLNFRSLDEHLNELETLFISEVDLLNEARNYSLFKKLLRENNDILVPAVFPNLCTSHVLVTEYIEGQSFDEFCSSATDVERKRAAELLWYASSYPVNVYGVFNADPHPGNFIFVKKQNSSATQVLKVAMVDFGFCKQWPSAFIDGWKAQVLACCQNDRQKFKELSERLGIRNQVNPKFFDELFDINHEVIYKPWLEDKPFHFTEEWLKYYLKAMLTHQILVEGLEMPKEFLALSRIYWGKFNLMTKLNVDCNYYPLTMPFIATPTKSIEGLK